MGDRGPVREAGTRVAGTRLARTRTAQIALASLVAVASASVAARADVTTVAANPAGDSYQADQPGLTPAVVSSPAFGLQFATAVTGQVYAQPLVTGDIVIVATEADVVYGIDRNSGAVRWQRSVGRPEPSIDTPGQCTQPSPLVGVTSTPVIDPATHTVYVMARSWDGTAPSTARWLLYALDAGTGGVRRGWPIAITARVDNDGAALFQPANQLQRPALAISGGFVWAGFGSFCDNAPARGYVATVALSGGAPHLWTDEAGQGDDALGSIWEAGGGFVVDRSGDVVLATGNGNSAPPAPGRAPPAPSALGDAVVRLHVARDGTVSARDWFSPADATVLNDADWDVGSAAPAALPAAFGTVAHPHLLLQAGKQGRVYLLDRDNLGGEAQGAGGTDAALAEAGPYEPVFGHPAAWPGDGGWVYLTGEAQPGAQANATAVPTLRAYHVTHDAVGRYSLTMAGAASAFGYGSGAPLVTSDGTKSGSATVWVTEAPCRVADGCPGPEEAVGTLRAYAPVPVGGSLRLIAEYPIGTQQKFSTPTADHGQLFVATGDGRLLAYGLRRPGYGLFGADGGVFAFGGAGFFGSPAGSLRSPITAAALTADGRGYWLAAADGGVFAYGDAGFYGSEAGERLAAPIEGIAPTATGGGYWLVAADGGVFTFGDASFHGSLGSRSAAARVVGLAPTPSGGGYWTAWSDGSVDAFGDARFFGSASGQRLGGPIVSIAASPTGLGYWLAGADGGVLTYGDARFAGSAGGVALAGPIVAIDPTATGRGYRLVGADGGVFSYGDATFLGGASTLALAGPIVGVRGIGWG